MSNKNRLGLEKHGDTRGKIKDFGDFLENKNEELEQLLTEREKRRKREEKKRCQCEGEDEKDENRLRERTCAGARV
jgi:hypothetical protein